MNPDIDHIYQQEEKSNPAINVVWQWLSYSLWELLLIALSLLLSSTLTYYFNHNINLSDSEGVATYSLIALICILPFTYLASRIFSKKETAHKRGFSLVIMVINALAVFLVTLAGFITTVLGLVSQIANDTSSSTTAITVTSSLIVTILGFLLFLRIINSHKLLRFKYLFALVIGVITFITIVLALFGPFKSEFANRKDRLIENNLPDISMQIENYVGSSHKLPDNLRVASLYSNFSSGDKALINKGIVSYIPVSNKPVYDPSSLYYYDTFDLCVTYTNKKGTGINDTNSTDESNGTINTDNHSSGNVCYKEQAYYYPGQ